MTNILSPEDYRFPAASSEVVYSAPLEQVQLDDNDEARIALEQALREAEHSHPISPNDIDEKRNERRQDETDRQLGRGVVDSLVSQYDASAQTKAEIETSTDVLLRFGAAFVMWRALEMQRSKESARND